MISPSLENHTPTSKKVLLLNAFAAGLRRVDPALQKVIKHLQKNGTEAYLVGGAVRDILLRCKILDYDIVTTMPSGRTLGKLASALKGRLTTYPEFGTASIILNQGQRFDFSQTRTEFYSQPAALPKIIPSNLLWDLFRRDFTINAMAISINNYDFGQLIDPFDGLNDLRRGIIRIIHERSFVDDPTRIFRALRYSARFNFNIEPSTNKLLHKAIKCGYHKLLSGERVKNELFLISKEQSWLRIIKKLLGAGIIKLSTKAKKELNTITEFKFLYLLANILAINKSRIPLNRGEKKIVQELKRLKKLEAKLKKAETKSQIYFVLEKVPTEVIAIFHDLAPKGIKLKINKFMAIKNIKPFVTGKDLARLKIKPGKIYNKILRRVLASQLDGKIKTSKQAELLIRRMQCL